MSRKKQTSNLITALYCRLSIDDGGDNESMSISNQKAMLRDYAEKNGMRDYAYYIDDGYTGRNFNRPGFQRMLTDIEAGRISCVITKDLSRLGRNYIEAGGYIEVYFPRHNVRYIAITDNVDSRDGRELDITPFKNILNDMYSRDISKKVLAGWMTRSRQGKFVGGTPPYGLMRDPNDGGHLIIDPETAPTIKLIFDLAANGDGCMRICKQLMERKIPITRIKNPDGPEVNYYSWGGAHVSKILRNPIYYGAHVVCRTHQKAIRSNTVNFVPRDEWEVIEGCHEAIVTKEQWDRVQKLVDRRTGIMQGNDCPYYNIFHGLVYCETCGKSMQSRYEKVGRTGKNRFTGEAREAIDKTYYICQTYNRLGRNACTSHKLEARDLHNIVLSDILDHAARALNNSEAFYAQLADRLEHRHTSDKGVIQKELMALTERSGEIDRMFLSLYEDKVKGVLSEQRFTTMTAQLEKEQEQGKQRVRELTEALAGADERTRDIRQFVTEVAEYASIEALDEAIVHRLIDKIIIGEAHDENGEKVQRVRIIYNFVGDLAGQEERS